METQLIIAVASGLGVLLLCLLILAGYICYRKWQQKRYREEEPEEPLDNVQTPNVIMTRKERTEDLFTGKRMPFGVHSSMSSIPDAIDGEDNVGSDGTTRSNGFKPKFQRSILSVHSVHSTTSNAPSFSEHAGHVNSSIHY